MSQENVEIVRASSELFARTGELPLSAWHTDIQWHTRADLADSRTYQGHAGMAKLASEWTEAFDDFRMELEELIDAGDRVVAVFMVRGRVRGSSQEVSMSETHIFRMRDGKVVECHEYATREEALEAVDLEV